MRRSSGFRLSDDDIPSFENPTFIKECRMELARKGLSYRGHAVK
jgi:hypothetical protein